MMNDVLQELLDRIRNSPTCYHAVLCIRKALSAQGYAQLDEKAVWELKPGGAYYVVRNGSGILSFRIPYAQTASGFRIAAAHSDSPSFKLKENAEKRDSRYVRLNTEKYGGMIMSSWLDRPLSAAGRVFCLEDGILAEKLFDLDRDLLLIPGVAIHMNREVNDGMKYQANIDTLPLYGGAGCPNIDALIAEQLGIAEKDILGKDVFLYCREKGIRFGAEGEFIASPRLDDLMCVYGCLEGFLAADTCPDIPVLAVFDNEEVGSGTKQGAASAFLRDTLRRVVLSLGGGEEEYLRLLAGSFMVSADNAHAVHPNHPEYSDADNCPCLNGGIVIKFNANQRYATDGRSAAVFRTVCAEAGVKTQVFANRSDLAGGSTLGSISNTMVPVSTVDIGLPQLSMHSAYETAGAYDYRDLISAMTRYYGRESV